MPKLTEAFAVVCDPEYTTDMFRYSLCQLSRIEDPDFEAQGRPISRCGKYFYWQSNKLIVSDTILVEADYDRIKEDDEIKYLNNRINMERAKSQQELEKKLDPLKARFTELLAITYQPTQAE